MEPNYNADYTVESSNPETHPDLVETQDLLVSIEGVDLADEHRSRVQTELQRTVRTKIEQLRQSGLEVAENGTLVSTPTDEIGVALRGLPLTEEGMRLIESSVRQTVRELLPAEAAARALSSNGRIDVRRSVWFKWFLDTMIAHFHLNGLTGVPSPGRPLMIEAYFPTQALRISIRNPADWPSGGSWRPIQRHQMGVSIDTNGNWSPKIAIIPSPNSPDHLDIKAEGSLFRDCKVPSNPNQYEKLPVRRWDVNDPTGYPGWTLTWNATVGTGNVQWAMDGHQFWHFFGGRWVDFCMFGETSSWEEWPYSYWPPGFLFRTSFESGDPGPTWRDNREYSANVTGYLPNINPECSPRHILSDAGGYPPHVGPFALMYSGTAQNNPTECNCYFRVFDLNHRVEPRHMMIYWIYPTEPLGRFVGVDLICTDGTSLRDSGAVDQNGHPMHPAAGHGDIPVGRWSLIQCDIGRWLGGKTLDRMLVAFDRTGVQGPFRGYIDDIYIGVDNME